MNLTKKQVEKFPFLIKYYTGNDYDIVLTALEKGIIPK